MTPCPAQDAEAIRRGYEQYAPLSVPPGMYFDHKSRLTLPQGVQPRSIGRVVAAYAVGFCSLSSPSGLATSSGAW